MGVVGLERDSVPERATGPQKADIDRGLRGSGAGSVQPEAPLVAAVRLLQHVAGVPTGAWVDVWLLAWSRGSVVVRTSGRDGQSHRIRSWWAETVQQASARLALACHIRLRGRGGVAYVPERSTGVAIWQFRPGGGR
jgi:hypothetical protein